MNDERFAELCESVKEAGAYLRGEPADVRVTFAGESDPHAVCERLRMTQARFAEMLRIRMDRLRSWMRPK